MRRGVRGSRCLIQTQKQGRSLTFVVNAVVGGYGDQTLCQASHLLLAGDQFIQSTILWSSGARQLLRRGDAFSRPCGLLRSP